MVSALCMRADGKIGRRPAHPVSRGAWLGWIPLALLLWLAPPAVADGASDAPTDRSPSVILISLDGTRPADVSPEDMPNLAGLAERGAAAERLVPVSPTNTFPNHVSLATGVTPERHGIVNNTFVDAERGLFEKKERDIPSWIQVEPVWSLLERSGIRTASYYWVGSEGAWPGGRAPSMWKKFDSGTPESEKVDQILEWMDLPDAERPRLITAWFRGGDAPGHRDGPGSAGVRSALRKQDREIGRLIAGLEERGRLDDTTLLFVSDHGMVAAEEEVDLGSALEEHDDIDAAIYGIGGFATVLLTDAQREQGAAAKVVARARSLGLEAHAREDAPPSWRVDNPRFGDVVVRAPIGTALVRPFLFIEGYHGYDPQAPEMAAIFYALGRGTTPGTSLGTLRAVDVAPTVLALFGEDVPGWMEGSPIDTLVPGVSASATLAPPVPSSEGTP